MRKHLALLLTLLVVSNYCIGDDISGYILKQNGDSQKVTFEVPIALLSKSIKYEEIEFKIKYKNAVNKYFYLKPSAEIKEVGFEYEGQMQKLISLKNTLRLSTGMNMSTAFVFIKILKEGKLNLFIYYDQMPTPMGAMGMGIGKIGTYNSSTAEQYIYQKENGELYSNGMLNSSEKLANYFSDCPIVVEKLNNKQYKGIDGEAIADDYNNNCK